MRQRDPPPHLHAPRRSPAQRRNYSNSRATQTPPSARRRETALADADRAARAALEAMGEAREARAASEQRLRARARRATN